MIDGTIIPAHRHAAGAQGGQEKEGLGRSCGGFSSKIQAKGDALGMPLEFIITAGQASDIGQAQAIIGEDDCDYLLADRGYDADHFRQYLEEKEMIPVLPRKKNRINEVTYDRHSYKERHAINVVSLFGYQIISGDKCTCQAESASIGNPPHNNDIIFLLSE